MGKFESQSFRENSPEKSLEFFNTNIKKFLGLESSDLKQVYDAIRDIDETSNYNKIGGSVAYALSIASVDAASKSLGIPFFKILNPSLDKYYFPFPLGNVLGGGAHAGPGTPDIQEYLICPIGAKNIREALEMNIKIHNRVRKILEKKDPKFTYGRGDEGGWAPNLDNDKAFEVVEDAILEEGYSPGNEVSIGIDFASSSLWNENEKTYDYSRQGLKRETNQQIEFINNMIKKYKLIYAEDPVHEQDFEGMSEITKKNINCLVTGDDLLVTNKKIVEKAIKYESCSGAILKVNQAGSLYDAIEFAKICNENNIKIITSHRSGESIDSHISHIALSTESKMIKTGVIGGERIAKLNELLRLDEYGLIEGLTNVF